MNFHTYQNNIFKGMSKGDITRLNKMYKCPPKTSSSVMNISNGSNEMKMETISQISDSKDEKTIEKALGNIDLARIIKMTQTSPNGVQSQLSSEKIEAKDALDDSNLDDFLDDLESDDDLNDEFNDGLDDELNDTLDDTEKDDEVDNQLSDKPEKNDDVYNTIGGPIEDEINKMNDE